MDWLITCESFPVACFHTEQSAENLDEVLELASHNASFSAIDSDAIQYFAARGDFGFHTDRQLMADVYAVHVAGGEDSCIGDIEHEHAHSDTTPVSTTTAASAPILTSTASASISSSKPADCHTHADGTLHCV